MAPKAPVGIPITKHYVVGPRIGAGAQATVHKLIPSDNTSNNQRTTVYAIKLAPVPTKKTKKGTSLAEINERSIRKEYQLYVQQFPDLQKDGTVAKMAAGKDISFQNISGTTQGYTYLAMELLQAPFFSMVPALSNGTVSLGDVAVRLLHMTRRIHGTGHLLVDTKPDNIMFAKTANNSKNPADLRIVDLGLIQSYTYNGHRPDEGDELQGTPLYASRHVHNGHTLSRRDDIEAVLLVLTELAIRVVAFQQGTVGDYEKGGSSDSMPSYLPWALEPSEQAIGACKDAQLHDLKSQVYQRMPVAVARILHAALQVTAKCGYKAEPAYNDLSKQLAKLKLPKKKAAAAAKKKAPVAAAAKAPATRKRATTTRYRLEETDSEEEESPAKSFKTCDEMDVDEDSASGADFDAETVDVEMQDSPNENLKPAAERRGLVIHFLNGAVKGLAFSLEQGETESLLVGAKPVKQDDQAVLHVDDAELDDEHLLFELVQRRRGQFGLEVTKLGSGSVVVGSQPVQDTLTAKPGTKVSFGTCEVLVSKLGDNAPAAVASPVDARATRRSTRAGLSTGLSPASSNTRPSAKAKESISPTVKAKQPVLVGEIEAIEGPYKGKVFKLERVGKEGRVQFLIGRAPVRPKEGDTVVALPLDTAMEANAVRITWGYHKKRFLVHYTNLKTKKDGLFSSHTLQFGKTVLKLTQCK